MRWTLGLALIAAIAVAGPARAQECAATIEANDLLQFNPGSLTVSTSCDSFSLTLKHVGKLAANVMGHNIVLTTTADYNAVANEGATAGLKNNFVPPDDDRVLAATSVIGGGEETTISFDPSTLEVGGDYTFFCSFPGHFAVMKGSVIVE